MPILKALKIAVVVTAIVMAGSFAFQVLDSMPKTLPAYAEEGICGDGTLNPATEQCDGSAGITPGVTTCDLNCLLVNVTGVCGDGVVNQPTEQCDGSAGITPGVTACTIDCTLEAVVGVCGDGVVNQPTEQCDGSAGLTTGNICTIDCLLEPITGGVCGDGIVNQAGEQCDGSAGVGAGETCTIDCLLQSVGVCGDGVINQAGEQCDGSAGVIPGVNTCTIDCLLEPIAGGVCGDGIVNQAGEECDGSAGVIPGVNTCTIDCLLEPIAGGVCGDGIVNQAGEECDGSAGVPNGYSCTIDCTLKANDNGGGGCTENCGGGGGGGGGGTPFGPQITLTAMTPTPTTTPNGQAIYTVTVKSSGSETAQDVTVDINLPNYFTLAQSGDIIDLGDMAVNQEKVITFTANVDAAATAGVYPAEIIAEQQSGAIADKKRTTTVNVEVVTSGGGNGGGGGGGGGSNPQIAADITKTVFPAFTNPGATVTYTITVSNQTSGVLRDLTIVDSLVDGFTYVENDGQTRRWTISELSPFETKVLTYEVKVDPIVVAGNYENTAVLMHQNDIIDQASVVLEVRIGQVAGGENGGFEEIPDTSSYLGLYYSIIILGLLTILAGYVSVSRQRIKLAQDLTGMNFIKQSLTQKILN